MDENIRKYIHILKQRDLFNILMSAFGSLYVFEKYVSYIRIPDVKIDKYNVYHQFNDLEDFFKNVKPSLMLSYAFIWSATREGDIFWRDINCKYRKRLGYNPSEWGNTNDDNYKIINFKKQ